MIYAFVLRKVLENIRQDLHIDSSCCVLKSPIKPCRIKLSAQLKPSKLMGVLNYVYPQPPPFTVVTVGHWH